MFNTSYGHCPLSKESTEATMALLISLVTRCISWLSAAVITTKTKSNMGGKGYLFCLTASPLSLAISTVSSQDGESPKRAISNTPQI